MTIARTERLSSYFHERVSKPPFQEQVKDLIVQLGGNTHVDLSLTRDARSKILESSLIGEARDFLLDVVGSDRLGITLHVNEIGEVPYYEIFAGRSESLRGLQCYGFPNQDIATVSPRQHFDPTTLDPLMNAESTQRLNALLVIDEEVPQKITASLLEVAQSLINMRPQGLLVEVQ